MAPAPALSGGRRRAAVAAVLAAAGPTVAAQCLPAGVALQAQAERSRWTEHDALGQRLVGERGTLAGGAIEIDWACGDWRAGLSVARRGGERAYDGRSSTGAVLASHSDITAQELRIALGPAAATGTRWQLALGWRQLDRRIADSGPVLGYPERFRAAWLEAGGRTTLWQPAGWQLDAEAGLAAGPRGHLALTLPGADPARLRLGTLRAATLGLRLDRRPDATGWGLGLVLRGRFTETGAGPSAAIRRDGQVFAGAAQPRTTESGWQLATELRYHFR